MYIIFPNMGYKFKEFYKQKKAGPEKTCRHTIFLTDYCA